MKPSTVVNAPLTASLVAVGLALTSPAVLLAQGQGGGGGGHTETATTCLSYPAVFTGTAVTLNGVEGAWTLGGALGTEFSFGCAIPVEEFPNTSCIKADGTFMTYDECLVACPSTPVERIYWQRESPRAVWQAGSTATTDPGGAPLWPATHVDWGDNLESQTWSATSVIRVETTTFATLPELTTLLGFQMWHVSGKGPDELWGVRATEPDETYMIPRPYVYDSPYAIIHAPRAHISFTKLETAASTCPTIPLPSPFEGALTWDALGHTWGIGDTALCTWNDLAYTVELNIGGKFVHGYNWQMSRVPPSPCPTYVKEGWWRLTYHQAADALAVDFTLANTLAPPVLTVPPIPPALEAEEEESGALYTPVVDKVNQLTYIDICLKGGKGGGGGGGGRR